ncbi:MAG: RND family transporter [Actinobacteria bacterium]|nr:RND family transporter [Actinomycetota bacterium]
MMQRFWSWLAVNLGKHAIVVTAVLAAFTVLVGTGITRLQFATGQDSYLNSNDQVYKDNVVYQKLFGGEAMLSVITMDPGHTVDELFTPEGLDTFRKVTEQVEATKGVQGVISPVTALQFSADLIKTPEGGTPFDSIAAKALLHASEVAATSGDKASAAAREADTSETAKRLFSVAVPDQQLSNPAWVKFLLLDNQDQVRKALRPFFPDKTHALMITRLDGNMSIEGEGAASDAVVAATNQLKFPNSSTVTTGAPILLKNINDYLKGGMLTLGGIAIVVMIIILLLFFSVRWRLLPLAVVLVGIVWAFGLAGYLGIPLTLVTIAGLPVMLGIGIDYAIQMHSRIEEEVIIAQSPHPIQEAARGLGPALLVVTFDAVFAFLALQISHVPMVRAFGWLLTVGIIAICVSSIINPLAILGMREYRSPTRSGDFSEGRLGRMVVWMGSLPGGFALPLAAVSIVVFVAGSVVEPSIKLETDPVNWVNPNSAVVQDLHRVEKEIGGSSELGIFVESKDRSSLYTDDVVSKLDAFGRQQMDEHAKVLLIGTGIINTVSDLTDVQGAQHVAPTAASVQAAWNVAPEAIKASTASKDGHALNLIYMTRPGSLEKLAGVVDDVRANAVPPAGTRLTPSGLAVVGVGLLQNLEANLTQLTWLAVGLVFLFLVVRLRSFTRALLSMVPVLVASGLATIAIWALGISLSPMTAIGGPLVVATCTEFTSLILLRYIEERRRGLDPRPAMDVTAARTGRAFIVSAMTAVAGVAVISFSSLPLLRNFGIFIALKVTIALLAALIVLPPLIIWADKRGWVSKGMLDHHVEPYLEVADHKVGVEATAAR